MGKTGPDEDRGDQTRPVCRPRQPQIDQRAAAISTSWLLTSPGQIA